MNLNDENWLSFCLLSLSGFFNRYVIYDIGSTDRSKEIIDWFVQKEKHNADFVVKYLPFVDPIVQGSLRNSMFQEANADWNFMVDSDEIYKPEDLRNLLLHVSNLTPERHYGIVRRVEVCEFAVGRAIQFPNEVWKSEVALNKAYGMIDELKHHRLYHHTTYASGPHPGETFDAPKQKDSTEFWVPNVTCYHFHSTYRSSRDKDVPKRIERRSQSTYHRGPLLPFDALKELPILRHGIEDFPLNPSLQALQEKRIGR